MNRERVLPWISTVVTMEFFEKLTLESAPSRPRLWKRYVDDTCCILRKGDVEGHLNSIRPTIEFAMEVEEGGSLPLGRRMVNWTLLYTVEETGTYTLDFIIQYM